MIDYTIYIAQILAGFCAIASGIKLYINRRVNKFHKSVAINIVVINIFYMLINFMWQSEGLNSLEDYNVHTVNYWLWTTWEIYIIAFSVYLLKKIEKIYYKK